MLSDDRLAELILDAEYWGGSTSDNARQCREIAIALAESQEARTLLQAALPHIRTCPGPTHHEDCACQVKRRIEAMGKGEET